MIATQAYCTDCGLPCETFTFVGLAEELSECCESDVTTSPKECDCCRRLCGRLIRSDSFAAGETFACPTCANGVP
jgi:hypothetical protein